MRNAPSPGLQSFKETIINNSSNIFVLEFATGPERLMWHVNQQKADAEPRFRSQIVPQMAAGFDSDIFVCRCDKCERSNDFGCDAMVAGHGHSSAAGPPWTLDVLYRR